MNSRAKGAENFFWTIKNGQFYFTKYMANDDFSERPQRADSIFILCRYLGLGHLRGPGVSLGRILGGPSIAPLFRGGGVLARGLCRPPPPLSIDSPVAPLPRGCTDRSTPAVALPLVMDCSRRLCHPPLPLYSPAHPRHIPPCPPLLLLYPPSPHVPCSHSPISPVAVPLSPSPMTASADPLGTGGRHPPAERTGGRCTGKHPTHATLLGVWPVRTRQRAQARAQGHWHGHRGTGA